MATNTNMGTRKGAVKSRSQFLNTATGHYIKRDVNTGRILGVKKDGKPYKGIRLEKVDMTYKPNPAISKATARKAEEAVLSVLNKRAIK